jgi:hypothetical protein
VQNKISRNHLDKPATARKEREKKIRAEEATRAEKQKNILHNKKKCEINFA